MRQIGTLPTAEQTSLFISYLFTHGIEAKGEQDDEGWAIWAFDEDRLNEIREEFATFQADPSAEKYQNLDSTVSKIVKERAEEVKAAQRNQVSVRKRWEQPAMQSTPLTIMLIMISVTVVLLGSSFNSIWKLCDKSEPLITKLTIAPLFDNPTGTGRKWQPHLGLQKVKQGQVWRLITPIFIHFDLLHILFNMLWLKNLGQIIERTRGSWRLLLMVLMMAILSNLAQYVWTHSPAFGGMSGVVYGLFGYVWMKSVYDRSAGFYIPPNIVFLMIGWFFLCMTGFVGPIANMAHAIGLGTGMIFGVIRPALRHFGLLHR